MCGRELVCNYDMHAVLANSGNMDSSSSCCRKDCNAAGKLSLPTPPPAPPLCVVGSVCASKCAVRAVLANSSTSSRCSKDHRKDGRQPLPPQITTTMCGRVCVCVCNCAVHAIMPLIRKRHTSAADASRLRKHQKQQQLLQDGLQWFCRQPNPPQTTTATTMCGWEVCVQVCRLTNSSCACCKTVCNGAAGDHFLPNPPPPLCVAEGVRKSVQLRDSSSSSNCCAKDCKSTAAICALSIAPPPSEGCHIGNACWPHQVRGVT
jgi:hypothetical protein